MLLETAELPANLYMHPDIIHMDCFNFSFHEKKHFGSATICHIVEIVTLGKLRSQKNNGISVNDQEICISAERGRTS